MFAIFLRILEKYKKMRMLDKKCIINVRNNSYSGELNLEDKKMVGRFLRCV